MEQRYAHFPGTCVTLSQEPFLRKNAVLIMLFDQEELYFGVQEFTASSSAAGYNNPV